MNNLLITVLLLAAASQTLAQETLGLNADDIALLDLQFEEVVAADRQVGVSLPGIVVAPPDASYLGISLYPGVLESWHQAAGAAVQSGDPLATIRSVEILAIQQAYLSSENELQLARQQAERDRQLFDAGIVSEKRLLETQVTLRGKQSQTQTLSEQLRQAGMRTQDLEALRSGNYALGTFTIRAPADGGLGHRAYTVGEHVPANAVVAELAGGDRLWLSVQVPSRLIPLLQLGSRLSTSGGDYSLTLRQRDFAVDTESQSVEVLAEFDQPVALIPGQLQTVVLHPQPGAILIPAAAVVHEGSESLVYIRNAAGVEVRSLDLIPMGDAYLANSGVRAGEQLLTRGTALIKGIQLGLGSDE